MLQTQVRDNRPSPGPWVCHFTRTIHNIVLLHFPLSGVPKYRSSTIHVDRYSNMTCYTGSIDEYLLTAGKRRLKNHLVVTGLF